MNKKAVLTAFFAVAVLVTRLGVFIFTPLYLDALSSWNTSGSSHVPNGSEPAFITNTTRPIYEQIDFFFAASFSMGFDSVILGVLTLITWLGCKGQITEKETSYPHRYFIIAGSAQGVSSLLFLYASSGSRTAPYLQALLGNFHIPLTFTARFLYLRKRPTARKFVCASLVVTSELVCLLPSIVPSLEPASDHKKDGGATGMGAILWPLCFVSSMIPAAVSNVVLEKTVKAEGVTASGEKKQLNMVYTLFWTYLSIFLTIVALFWTDLIPKFGLAPSLSMFFQLIRYNALCVFGAAPACGYPVPLLAWGRMVSKTFNVLASAFLIRYGEGASILVIVLAMRTPSLFLFWTLFEEHPFAFAPHVDLSTWLSIGAICVMLPAIVVYNTGASETVVPPKRFNRNLQEAGEEEENEDRAPLLEESMQVDSNDSTAGMPTPQNQYEPSKIHT